MLDKEPAVVFNGLGQVFAAVVPVLILFDIVHWTDKQTAGVMFLSGVLITFLSTVFTRSQTVSVSTANSQIQAAIDSPSTTTVAKVIAKEKEENP